MKLQEVLALKAKYFDREGYTFPDNFEHRLEQYSSAILYSFIREYKPTSVLGIGTWKGGSTCVMMAALLKNKNKFHYVASELADDLREHTRYNCTEKNGIAPTMIGDITKNLDKVPESIELLYVDTDHDEETTRWIVENIFPRVAKGGLVVFHDWAVQEIDGNLFGKAGTWPETNYLVEMIRNGTFPFKKVFWTYMNPDPQETAIWRNE